MRRPGEMLREARRLVTVAEDFKPRDVIAVERPHRTDRQSDTMNRQRIALAQRGKLGMRRSSGAHIVFRVYLEESDRLDRGEDVVKVPRLEAGAGARWKVGYGGHANVHLAFGRRTSGRRARREPGGLGLARLKRARALGGPHRRAGSLGDILPGIALIIGAGGAGARGSRACRAVIVALQRDAEAFVLGRFRWFRRS